MKALTFSSFGGSELLQYIDVPDPVLRSDEILIKTNAIGLNFADIYRRKGNYHLKGKPPYIAGYEGAGIVVNSNGYSQYKKGDRVAFADVPFANAELVAVPVTHTIPLPDDISDETAASVLLQGLTAQYLAQDSYNIKQGDTVLIHAAAGGVGNLLLQIAKFKDARIIGLSSSRVKLPGIISSGAHAAFNLQGDWQQQVMDFTWNQGVDVVYDSIGSTLGKSFEVTRIGGTVVFYGMSGGDPALIDPRMLMDTSKTLTGGDLWNYLTSAEERIRRSAELFAWIREGKITVKPPVPVKFRLADGAQAHELLESGKNSGKILLIP